MKDIYGKGNFKMKKQFIVLGLGSFGASVAVTLQRLGCDVVAVDHDM